MNCKMVEVCKILGINPTDIATEESEKLSIKYDLPKGTYVNVLKAPRLIPMPKVKPPTEIDKQTTKIIILKAPTRINYDNSHWNNLEEEYSKKFGCKVIILRDGLDLTGTNNG